MKETPDQIGHRIAAVYIGNGSYHHAVKAIAQAILDTAAECAKIADGVRDHFDSNPHPIADHRAEAFGADEVAVAIRHRYSLPETGE